MKNGDIIIIWNKIKFVDFLIVKNDTCDDIAIMLNNIIWYNNKSYTQDEFLMLLGRWSKEKEFIRRKRHKFLFCDILRSYMDYLSVDDDTLNMMLSFAQQKSENYISNILIGGCILEPTDLKHTDAYGIYTALIAQNWSIVERMKL